MAEESKRAPGTPLLKSTVTLADADGLGSPGYGGAGGPVLFRFEASLQEEPQGIAGWLLVYMRLYWAFSSCTGSD